MWLVSLSSLPDPVENDDYNVISMGTIRSVFFLSYNDTYRAKESFLGVTIDPWQYVAKLVDYNGIQYIAVLNLLIPNECQFVPTTQTLYGRADSPTKHPKCYCSGILKI